MFSIATHNKIFHADEVTAIALLKIFTKDEITIHRIDHLSENFLPYDMVIDIGRKFDGIKYFDHHQNRGGKSSAGLIWDYLELNSRYPRIGKLIHQVDMNDTGVQKAEDFEYASLIKAFNAKELLSQEQERQFERAVEFSMTIIEAMVRNQQELEDAQEIVKNSYYFHGNPKILELESFTPHWSSYINGVMQPHIKAVVWKDFEEKTWKVKLSPKHPGSFELCTKPLIQDPSMIFVHASGHFAVARDEAQMASFLSKCIR